MIQTKPWVLLLLKFLCILHQGAEQDQAAPVYIARNTILSVWWSPLLRSCSRLLYSELEESECLSFRVQGHQGLLPLALLL